MSEFVVITLPRVRSWRKVSFAVALAVVAITFAIPQSREAIGRTWEPKRVADRTVLVAQREGVEQALARVYAKGLTQIQNTRKLTLPIGSEEATAIEKKALDEIRLIRRNALVASARAYGLNPGEADGYARGVEPQLDAPPETAPGRLLAPPLFQIVARAAELSAQAADEGTRELTRPRTTPRPSASPSARP